MRSRPSSSAICGVARAELIASLAKLAWRGSRCEAAAFLARSPTKACRLAHSSRTAARDPMFGLLIPLTANDAVLGRGGRQIPQLRHHRIGISGGKN